MIRTLTAFIVGGFFTIGGIRAAEVIEVPLAQVKGTGVFSGYKMLKIQLKQPPGEWKLPKLTAPRPLYAMTKLGDSERLMVADYDPGSSSFYDKIYFDANANRDLTDDPVINAAQKPAAGKYRQAQYKGRDIQISLGGKTVPYNFTPMIYGYGLSKKTLEEMDLSKPPPTIRFYLQASCYYRGTFKLNDKIHSVVLTDSNVNGSFADHAVVQKTNAEKIMVLADNFFLTGRANMVRQDANPLPTHLELGSQLYRLKIDIPANKMTLSPETAVTGKITTTSSTESLLLVDKTGKNVVMAFRPSGGVSVLPGEYRLLKYTMMAKKDDAIWRVIATGGNKADGLTVAAGKTASMTIGAPYTVSAIVPDWSRKTVKSRKSLSLNLSQRGTGGEFVSSVTSGLTRKNLYGRNPDPATYVIMTAEGDKVQSGKFEYG